MKAIKMILLMLAVVLTTSAGPRKSYPCHALGDLGPCTHPKHDGDLGPCGHTYYNAWGVLCTQHAQDLYPCVHPVHSAGDLYPCTHVCW